MKLGALHLRPNESHTWPTLSDSFVSPKVQVHLCMPQHTARDMVEQVQGLSQAMPSSLPGPESTGQCYYQLLASTFLPSAGPVWSSLVGFIPHPSFFSIRAHLFAISPPQFLANKQPGPDYFPCIGPGFVTAPPSCGTSDAIIQAVTASHCYWQPGSPWPPHGCPVRFSLPPAIT